MISPLDQFLPRCPEGLGRLHLRDKPSPLSFMVREHLVSAARGSQPREKNAEFIGPVLVQISLEDHSGAQAEDPKVGDGAIGGFDIPEILPLIVILSLEPLSVQSNISGAVHVFCLCGKRDPQSVC